jgi:hypothetical protein
MTHAISLLCLFAMAGAPTTAPAVAPSNASREAAALALIEVRLGASLDPARRAFAVDGGPVVRPAPLWQQYPATLPPRARIEPPAPPEPAGRPIRPYLYPEPVPLSEILVVAVDVPKDAKKLPVGELVKQWAPSAAEAPPLPVFGLYLKDRTSLADPSLEASTGMTRTPQAPVRVGEVPFSPWNLPDPFENGTAIRLRDPWVENALPPFFPNSPTRK